VTPGRSPARHLRPRGVGVEQPVTTVELFFDLVYVFAITQLSHMILGDLTVAEVGRAAFLLLIVWWAWIYTTWMVNWFDPASPMVRAVVTGVMLASLLMAAALPGAFGAQGVLFAISYVVLQVGRNAAAALLLRRGQPLRDIFERLVGWSAASGVLWLAGAALPGDRRLLLWIPAVVLDLCAPVAGYWVPRRGRAVTTDYDIEGGHFTDRCQGFIIIALGESIVVTGATAADAGLTSTVVVCLGIAFLETAALWWLYFGAVAERSRDLMSTSEDPGRLARDAYTYLHVPIVAGIIAAAVGGELLIAEPGRALHGVGLAMVLGGPALYLLGESLFRLRVTGAANPKRLAAAAILVLLAPIGSQISALALSATVAAVLSALAVWELGTPARQRPRPERARRRTRRAGSWATFGISSDSREEYDEDWLPCQAAPPPRRVANAASRAKR
jgi:low temperature requirement protein LtrA